MSLLYPHPNPTFGNPSFAEASLRVLIVRLSPWRDVDRSTPHLVLFQALRRAVGNAYLDLAFFPAQDERARLEAARQPLLLGSQAQRPAGDYDLVLVSNAYALELLNLPYLLLRSGVPLLASQRGDEWPPIVLGGSNALAAQAVVTESGDSLADALFFGEGEEAVGALARAILAGRGETKQARLARAAGIAGLWVTGAWPDAAVPAALIARPGAEHLLTDYPILDGPEASTARLQISFGCPAFCTFCFEGYERRPYREIALQDLSDAARRLKCATGCRSLELYSFNFDTHSDIPSLLFELNQLFEHVGAMSQRVDLLHCTPGLLETEVAADKRQFTLGIEGISGRLRTWLHKSLPDDAISDVLGRLLRQRIRQMKLFYLLTGYEEESDFQEFRAFVRELKALRRASNPGIRVTFSFSLLVRMPFTPLQYDRLFLEYDHWRPIIGAAKSACETNGFEFRLASDWDEYCVSQVLALGSTWLWRPLAQLAEDGHCYDGHLPRGYWGALRGWLTEHGHWSPELLGEKGPDAVFPLSFVKTRTAPGFLYREYARAQAGLPDEGYCLGRPGDAGRCLGCGACEDGAQRAALTEHAIRPADGAHSLPQLQRLMQSKWRLKPLYVRVGLPRAVAGAGPEWLNAWVLRALLAAHPEETEYLLAAQESLFTVGDNRGRFGGLWGETVFALKSWEPEGLRETLFGTAPRCHSDLELLSEAQAFVPGVFRRAELAFDVPASRFAGMGQGLVAYLRSSFVPCNLRREGGRYWLDLPQKALKKNVVLAGSFVPEGDVVRAVLSVGPKFDLGAMQRSAEGHDGSAIWPVNVSNVEW